jgi:hypothetical protein
MKTNESGSATAVAWAGPVTLLATAGLTGVWVWQTQGAFVPLGPTLSLLGLAMLHGVVWLSRVRAAHRLFAVLDAYAEQELARAERRGPPPAMTSNRSLARSNI